MSVTFYIEDQGYEEMDDNPNFANGNAARMLDLALDNFDPNRDMWEAPMIKGEAVEKAANNLSFASTSAGFCCQTPEMEYVSRRARELSNFFKRAHKQGKGVYWG